MHNGQRTNWAQPSHVCLILHADAGLVWAASSAVGHWLTAPETAEHHLSRPKAANNCIVQAY
eukprot:15454657-Alexandrium_andersonii.AAC.1